MKRKNVLLALIVVSFLMIAFIGCNGNNDIRPAKLTEGLENSYFKEYTADGDGGLAHITYWTMTTSDFAYQILDPQEQAKIAKIQANAIHSKLFQPVELVAGYEATGLLTVDGRTQNITLKVPKKWNGDLIVAGTPGLRNEYANESSIVPWILEEGYAYIAGDKGLLHGSNEMLSGNHPTSNWGIMMMDLGHFAKERIEDAWDRGINHIYVIGLSNGGYQTRRAMELDHEAVMAGAERLFDGGVDWSGAYWPDARVLDANGDGKVSVSEYVSANTLIGLNEIATLAMKWPYAADTQSTPEHFYETPPFSAVQDIFVKAGFSAESAPYWGYYNTVYDSYKSIYPTYKGVGYYNLVAYLYKADLLGDDAVSSAGYTCFSDPSNPDAEPPLYAWLKSSPTRNWTDESVEWALKNANTGEFSAPLLSVHGQMDALVPLYSQAVAYKDAVEKYGAPEYYRLYIVENAGHVDSNADGGGDWDFDHTYGEEGMADKLTPLQAYVRKAFDYLKDWTEKGIPAPASTTISNDPANDVVDYTLLSW